MEINPGVLVSYHTALQAFPKPTPSFWKVVPVVISQSSTRHSDHSYPETRPDEHWFPPRFPPLFLHPFSIFYGENENRSVRK